MSATIYRGPLTDLLLSTLVGVGKPVGDGQRPKTAGWSGQPNAPGAVFTPYLVLAASASSRSAGSFGNPQAEWQLNYLVSTYGVQRDQCDWMADRARTGLSALKGTDVTLGPSSYRIQQVWTQSIGGLTPNFTTDPPVWSQQDQLVVWLSKELS
jgi:hypothetical protein